MVKHTQTIRRQNLTNCLIVFDYFVGLALKWLNHSLTGTLTRSKEITHISKVNRKTSIFYPLIRLLIHPLIHLRICISRVRNVSFSENFAYISNRRSLNNYFWLLFLVVSKRVPWMPFWTSLREKVWRFWLSFSLVIVERKNRWWTDATGM